MGCGCRGWITGNPAGANGLYSVSWIKAKLTAKSAEADNYNQLSLVKHSRERGGKLGACGDPGLIVSCSHQRFMLRQRRHQIRFWNDGVCYPWSQGCCCRKHCCRSSLGFFSRLPFCQSIGRDALHPENFNVISVSSWQRIREASMSIVGVQLTAPVHIYALVDCAPSDLLPSAVSHIEDKLTLSFLGHC